MAYRSNNYASIAFLRQMHPFMIAPKVILLVQFQKPALQERREVKNEETINLSEDDGDNDTEQGAAEHGAAMKKTTYEPKRDGARDEEKAPCLARRKRRDGRR
ncbi:uncharacterized protein LOC127747536 isoform X2 [Arachis duranensis]|uniref:Uncharacterized protein LOC127747536 isoform X2 n=1 Tax=Arachis duranensis TaxID=130453 RepID=A0A9C6WTV4_ARADU|nr:uncharacterized protein LOC127747536 isoform X2 [Arachis duranensis]